MFNEINIELTSRCNKMCAICPRWRDGKEKGDASVQMLEVIERQLDDDIIIHFHNNGEPLVYPHIAYALSLFSRQIKHFDTNGILLLERAEDIEKADIISVSIIQDDPIGHDQLAILEQYLARKPKHQMVIARCVGDIDGIRMERIRDFNIPIVHRILHDKSGRTAYTKATTKPEDMICRDLLNHPAIDRDGNFYVCVKYDPHGAGIIGNVLQSTIKEIWEGEARKAYLAKHVSGSRCDLAFCRTCEYYGIPTC